MLGSNRSRSLSAGQGSGLPSRGALITGCLLRLARESVPGGYSQEQLAEVVAVSPDTVAGWETGRRPLTAVRAGRFVGLRTALAHLGAAPHIIRLLSVALDADQIFDYAMAAGDRYEPGDLHPLGAHVHRREAIELTAWALGGRRPAGLPPSTARRGPVAPGPEPGREARSIVFDHFRRVAETAGEDDALLRRQAHYLQSFDQRRDAAAWMTGQYRQTASRRAGWAAAWPGTRTLAVALARYGDPGPLIDFSEYGLADEPGQVANLNYWAYWIGEMPAVERDDSFMPAQLAPWHGDRVLRHLSGRLEAAEGVSELGIHTIGTLLAARPRLLDHDPALIADLSAVAGRLMDGGKISSSARRVLSQVWYALRLHIR